MGPGVRPDRGAPAARGVLLCRQEFEGVGHHVERGQHAASLGRRLAVDHRGVGRPGQSPVDLANAENADVADLVVDYKAAPLVIVNNGHAIQVDCANGSSITVGEERYDLQQFHFHGPSEHTVNGKYAPMEAHFVHKNSLGQLAVIGVLIEEGPEHTELTEIWNEMPKSKGPARTVASVQVDPAALLPKDRISFRYSGSLTTPPCFEDVRWIVMQAPIRVSKEQVTAFRKVIGRNNRPVQPLHGRTERLGR